MKNFNYSTDMCVRTKLRLACLEYSFFDIYCLSFTNHSNSRALLIALTWLITKNDVLKNAVRSKLLNSTLGREFSRVDIDRVRF